jgi:hypothetical protein
MSALHASLAACFADVAADVDARAPSPLVLVPCTLTRAFEYVREHHRHHKPPTSGLFAVAVARDGALCGVAIAGRPVARMLDDGATVEVTRVATDGTRNACSMLYGAIWRAARALGYRRAVTYTLPSEGGASLRASGWICRGRAGGGSWSRDGRERIDQHPTEVKARWEVSIAPANDNHAAKE